MITNNKILTVSYGTFSCTLEGFDDSFGTMKAIAEYFRDLASDDRYFGAEPPQPDVEMLARIAQKEISRRVEAREHEGNYVLSAVDEDQPSTVSSDGVATGTVATGAAVAGATAATALMQEATPELEQANAQPVSDLTDDTTDASDHSLAEEPVQQDDEAQEDTDTAPVDAVELDSDTSEDNAQDLADPETDSAADSFAQVDEDHEEATAQDLADDQTPAAQFVEDENDIVPGQPDAEVEAFFASNPTGTNQNDFEEIAELTADAEAPVEAEVGAGANTIAAKLQRIRAVVAQNDDAVENAEFSEDEHAEDNEENVVVADTDGDDLTDEIPEIADDTLSFEDLQPDQADMQVEEDAQDMDEVEAASSEETQDASDTVETAPHDDEDDIADILSRLDQAEAAEAEARVDTDESADKTLISEDFSAADNDDLENLFDAEDVVSDETAEADVADAADLSEESQTAYEASADQRIDVKPTKTPAEEALADAADAMAARPRARVIKVKRADLDAAVKRGDLEEVSDETPKRPDLDKHHLAPGKFGTSSLSAEDEAELARELAALEADIEMDQPTEDSDAPADDLSETMTLSPEMRADVDDAAEVAEVDEVDAIEEPTSEDWTDEAAEATDEAAALETADEQPQQQDTAEEEEDTSGAAATRRDAMPSPDQRRRGYMSRLLAETDNQMDEPEGATRRDAFAHLRAAVAAKKADDALGTGADTVEGDDAYRNDLADVVRPRRPDRSGARTPRPGEGGPAPLKLVAEQRIDVEDSTAADPVRPRRVEAVDDSTQSEGESFADFANDMGATTLPQQLEAAAAYMSFVEGRDQFSRPQLMAKVRQVNAQDGFSREDGLRHFGQLLRSGKIEKVKGGRFTVSEDIGFRPDHRAAS